MNFLFSAKSKKIVLALGPESAGNFSVFKNGKIYLSPPFGDLLEEKNFLAFKKAVLAYLKTNKIKPDIALTDLHPLYRTTQWGIELAKKFKAQHIGVQHHIAHIFSAVGDCMMNKGACHVNRQNAFYGIAADGTGFGIDGKIWGGEIFKLKITNYELQIERVGHLENQILIGGDLAVKEPARMLIAILAKIDNYKLRIANDHIFSFVKKYYTRREFDVLYSQLRENFNCIETSSTGRVLDAVSILLGFIGNERKYKHEPVEMLEKNSTKPYHIAPLVKGDKGGFILETTPLFEYLIKNIGKDKKRLAATAQYYIAEGFQSILNEAKRSERFRANKTKRDSSLITQNDNEIYFAGGMANNKIISSYLEKQGVRTNKKIPRGDAGLSFGQIVYYLILS